MSDTIVHTIEFAVQQPKIKAEEQYGPSYYSIEWFEINE